MDVRINEAGDEKPSFPRDNGCVGGWSGVSFLLNALYAFVFN
jgi:hypothetical protein